MEFSIICSCDLRLYKPKIQCIHHSLFIFLACSCPEIGSPVCGENGKEYENDCLAKCDGVEKKCDGKCPCKKRN